MGFWPPVSFNISRPLMRMRSLLQNKEERMLVVVLISIVLLFVLCRLN